MAHQSQAEVKILVELNLVKNPKHIWIGSFNNLKVEQIKEIIALAIQHWPFLQRKYLMYEGSVIQSLYKALK